MTERDLSWLEDDGPPESGVDYKDDEPEEDLDAAAAKLTAEDEETEEEDSALDVDTGADALLRWNEKRGQADTDADRLFEAQKEQARKLSRDYQPDPEPLSPVEEAAVVGAQLSRDDLDFFAAQLRDANAATARRAKANQPGFDSNGDPLVVEPAYSPVGLDSQSFDLFIEAVKSGGARPDRVPPGESYESWSAKVDSALGVGAER